MITNKSRHRLMLALPFALVAACGSGPEERPETPADSADRALDLALSGDTAPATFEDTALTERTEPEKATEPPRPNRPRPRPAQEEPPPVVETPPPPPPEPETITLTVPAGTTLQLALNETLSTETNQPGDGFTATLMEPVLALNGEIVIPVGATVRGRVTQVQKSGRVGETAILNLAFEAISFDGESHPLDASIVSANPERVGRSSAGEQVGKAAAGAAAGAILGRVLGKDTRSTIKGAVIGAAAGTAIAMGTADVDAVLKEGSVMVIKVDSPITITRPSFVQ